MRNNYGDEYGLPGGGDPDNRRMMEFEGYDMDELALKNKVVELNKVRSTELALIYGSTEVEIENESIMVIRRKYLNQEVIVLINKSTEAKTLILENPKQKNYNIHFSKKSNQKEQKLKIELAPLSFEYLISKPTQP